MTLRILKTERGESIRYYIQAASFWGLWWGGLYDHYDSALWFKTESEAQAFINGYNEYKKPLAKTIIQPK